MIRNDELFTDTRRQRSIEPTTRPVNGWTDRGHMWEHKPGWYLALLTTTAVALLAGCRINDPNFCCETAESCAAVGVDDELRLCAIGRVCQPDHRCVLAPAIECETSLDCNSPDAPTCASDGMCVGCTSNDQCPPEKEICNAETRSCSLCTADRECASGVCIEADGTCADEDSVVYVSTSLSNDAGDCPKATPCRSIEYALGRITPTRRVVRLLEGTHQTRVDPIKLDSSVIIDGEKAIILSTASPIFSVTSFDVTIEGVAAEGVQFLNVGVGGEVRLVKANLDLAHVEVAGGTLTVADARVLGTATSFGPVMSCRSGGSLTISRSVFENAPILSTECKLHLTTSRLGPGFAALELSGGTNLIENNVFRSIGQGELFRIYGVEPGSSFRFNTMTRSAVGTAGGPPIFCGTRDFPIEISNNIIAFNVADPLNGCPAHHTLFDLAATQGVQGEGNQVADGATFFRNPADDDYHLAPNSPAIGMGEIGLTATDFDGIVRPMPTGTKPDVGAYEVP